MQAGTYIDARPEVDLEELLISTSRTFALAIPLLPEPTRREVTLSYLLFRIADTFEDASAWPVARRIEALDRFARILEDGDPPEIERLAGAWATEVPCEQPAYRELLANVPEVLKAFRALEPRAAALIRDHTIRTAQGMAGFVARVGEAGAQGELRLLDLEDLRAYCYVVAGIVGELLTELYLLRCPTLLPAAAELRRRAREFGEGLQLVNILKDSARDATEGRMFLPAAATRGEVAGLARRDLEVAAEYVRALQEGGAERGVVAFNALPAALAVATVDRLEASGPGSKLSRPEVFAIVQGINQALDRDEPVHPLLRGRGGAERPTP